MASVVIIYTARQFVSRTALAAYTFGAAFMAATSLVSFSDVLANLLQVGFVGFGRFVFVALIHTGVLVQLLTAVVAVSAVLLVRSIALTSFRSSAW